MSEEDAPVKKPRSEAQIQALNKARAKALELRTQRNDIRQNKNITDDIDATPEEKPTDDAETENSETDETETESDEEPKAAVVETKETKAKTEPARKPKPAPKPKPQSKPQQIEEHVPIPQNNFRMMNRNQYILFEE